MAYSEKPYKIDGFVVTVADHGESFMVSASEDGQLFHMSFYSGGDQSMIGMVGGGSGRVLKPATSEMQAALQKAADLYRSEKSSEK